MICKPNFEKKSKEELIKILILFAPRLPPKTRSVFFWESSLKNEIDSSRLLEKSNKSCLTGLPVNLIFSEGK